MFFCAPRPVVFRTVAALAQTNVSFPHPGIRDCRGWHQIAIFQSETLKGFAKRLLIAVADFLLGIGVLARLRDRIEIHKIRFVHAEAAVIPILKNVPKVGQETTFGKNMEPPLALILTRVLVLNHGPGFRPFFRQATIQRSGPSGQFGARHFRYAPPDRARRRPSCSSRNARRASRDGRFRPVPSWQAVQ